MNPFSTASTGAPSIVAAAAAAAVPGSTSAPPAPESDDEMDDPEPTSNGVVTSTRTLDPVAYGRCSSVESAYKALTKSGMDPKVLPTHVEADQALDPANLTIFATQTAVRNGVKAAVAIQRTKKRTPDGSQQLNVGWVLLP